MADTPEETAAQEKAEAIIEKLTDTETKALAVASLSYVGELNDQIDVVMQAFSDPSSRDELLARLEDQV